MKIKTAKPAMVEFSKIDFGQRFRDEYNNIEDLQKSIATNGLIQSLMVFPRKDGKYTLIAGGRRFVALRGLKNAGVDVNGSKVFLKDIYKDEKIPVLLGWEGMTSVELRMCELEENIQRQNLTPVEQAKLIAEIHRLRILIYGEKKSTSPDAEGWSASMTANLIGKTPSYVSQALSIAQSAAMIPDLDKTSTWREAQKMIKKTEQQLEQAISVGMIREGLAEQSDDVNKKALDDWYVVGDFFKRAAELPDRSADCIELDPPFGIDLKNNKVDMGDISDSYTEWDKHEYKKKMKAVFEECWRISKDNSWLLCWFAPEPWFEDIFQMIKKQGWWVRRMPAIWDKTQGQTMQATKYLANTYEMFFYASKGNAMLNKTGRGNIFRFSGIHPDKKPHLTAKPVELYEEIFETFTRPGDRIVVPFAGSGSQLLAMANIHRTGIGFDLSQEHKDKFTFNVYSQEYGKYKL